MSEEQVPVREGGTGVIRYVVIAVAVAYVLASLYMIVDLRGRLSAVEKSSQAQEVATKEIQDKLHMTNKSIEQASQALASKVGMTQEELNRRTAELAREQRVAESRLTEEQKKTQQAVAGVSGEVAGVKTDLGSARGDIATTKTDLESTKAKLEKAIGDLGVQSGLIARNHDELEVLKHKGDRNYFEFTLYKNKRTPVSSISLELKKADSKKSRFTLNVLADDKTIEKKDRTMNEPMQFYTGRERTLYEVVIYQVTKDQVTGYLTTPK